MNYNYWIVNAVRRRVFEQGVIADSSRVYLNNWKEFLKFTRPYYGYDSMFYLGRVTFSRN